jgi:chromosome segregation ATPase
MKAASLLTAAIATALLVAATVQAASLKKRLESLPSPAAASATGPSAEIPPSPYEMKELAKRVDAIAARLEGKIERERKELREAQDRYKGIGVRTAESLAAMEKEAAEIRDLLGDLEKNKDKVAEMTKRIRNEQQKAMIKRFMAGELKKENEKLKAELGLTAEQGAQFDRVFEETADQFAEMGSAFMDGDANPAKFMEVVAESNRKMATFLTEDQMKKYTEIQQSRWGGGRRGGGGGDGGGGGGQ